jgi:hypothetical protein
MFADKTLLVNTSNVEAAWPVCSAGLGGALFGVLVLVDVEDQVVA